MANINIENILDLDLDGNILFDDDEGFMTELSEDKEIEAINGGYWTNGTPFTNSTCGETFRTQ